MGITPSLPRNLLVPAELASFEMEITPYIPPYCGEVFGDFAVTWINYGGNYLISFTGKADGVRLVGFYEFCPCGACEF